MKCKRIEDVFVFVIIVFLIINSVAVFGYYDCRSCLKECQERFPIGKGRNICTGECQEVCLPPPKLRPSNFQLHNINN